MPLLKGQVTVRVHQLELLEVDRDEYPNVPSNAFFTQHRSAEPPVFHGK